MNISSAPKESTLNVSSQPKNALGYYVQRRLTQKNVIFPDRKHPQVKVLLQGKHFTDYNVCQMQALMWQLKELILISDNYVTLKQYVTTDTSTKINVANANKTLMLQEKQLVSTNIVY